MLISSRSLSRDEERVGGCERRGRERGHDGPQHDKCGESSVALGTGPSSSLCGAVRLAFQLPPLLVLILELGFAWLGFDSPGTVDQ